MPASVVLMLVGTALFAPFLLLWAMACAPEREARRFLAHLNHGQVRLLTTSILLGSAFAVVGFITFLFGG